MDTDSVAAAREPDRGFYLQSISRSNLDVLLHEADLAARRLVRGLGLPSHARDDHRQELLLDLIGRLKWFDPNRGPLGAFAGAVVRHRAALLAKRIRRERAIFVPVARDGYSSAAGINRVDGVVEPDRYMEVLGQSADGPAAVERRVDIDGAFASLRPDDLNLCVELIDRTPTEISRSGHRSRAAVYRQLKEIRLRMLTAGVAAGM